MPHKNKPLDKSVEQSWCDKHPALTIIGGLALLFTTVHLTNKLLVAIGEPKIGEMR